MWRYAVANHPALARVKQWATLFWDEQMEGYDQLVGLGLHPSQQEDARMSEERAKGLKAFLRQERKMQAELNARYAYAADAFWTSFAQEDVVIYPVVAGAVAYLLSRVPESDRGSAVGTVMLSAHAASLAVHIPFYLFLRTIGRRIKGTADSVTADSFGGPSLRDVDLDRLWDGGGVVLARAASSYALHVVASGVGWLCVPRWLRLGVALPWLQPVLVTATVPSTLCVLARDGKASEYWYLAKKYLFRKGA